MVRCYSVGVNFQTVKVQQPMPQNYWCGIQNTLCMPQNELLVRTLICNVIFECIGDTVASGLIST